MNRIKVSSITYVKNGKCYIEQCIRSIMNQTLKEIEILIVDGGSDDGTVEILKKLREEDSRIQLLHEEGSVGKQFNAALERATGEYIAVCEGDDYILPDKYEKQYQIASENRLDVIRACYFQFFNCKGKEYRYKVETGPSNDSYNRFIEIQDDRFLSLGVNGFWNGLYLRDFLLDNDIRMNETRGAAYQDISFSFLCQAKAKRIWFMDEALHGYRIDNPDASVNSLNCIDLHVKEYELLANKLKKLKLYDKLQEMFLVWEIGSYKHFTEELPEENKVHEIKKIYEVLHRQKIVKSFQNVSMPERTYQLIRALYTSEHQFRKFMMIHSDVNQKMLEYFKGRFKQEKEVILFGAGHFGGILYDYLILCNKKFIIADNNSELQNRGYRGKKVYPPETCVNRNENTILIANVHHAKEICVQLEGMKVNRSRIIVCCNEDLFLRKIFALSGEKDEYNKK